MVIIVANDMHFKDLNEQIRTAKSDTVTVDNCIGQRYIGDGLSGKTITINGTPGNALGAYLNSAQIYVNGNAQDATGYAMHGSVMYLRCNEAPRDLPAQVVASPATQQDIATILPHQFYVLRPDTKNPYKQLYTHN